MNLQAGPLQIRYENGFLRQIKQHGLEVVRMMYFALRDQNWGTLGLRIENEVIDNQENSFSISYACFNIDGHDTAIFAWDVQINGQNDGTITFEIRGKALGDILRNRAGFCILHPIKGTAEQPITISHDNNTTTNTHFPRYIAAVDPFLNIRSMRWQCANNAAYQLDFEGDTFQTEDQRNWGDASYKTFCTPLSLPFPVQLHKGDSVWQRVTFRPLPDSMSIGQDSQAPISPEENRNETPQAKSFPLGIAASIEAETLSETAADLLKSLKLSHYRIDLNPSEANWITTFSAHCENASLLDLPLEIALFLENDDTEKLHAFVLLCQQNRLNIKQLILLSAQTLTTPQVLIQQISLLKQQLPKVKIGVGTDYNFTELNRHRFEVGEADFVSFTYHPQAHAFDDLSLIENTETLRYLVESAEKLYQKPVHISFISLQKRSNPYSTATTGTKLSIEKQADSRQKITFGAEWVRLVLANLAHTNVSSVTLFRTTGELGLMTIECHTYPVFDVLKK